jgi:hypothetical protein
MNRNYIDVMHVEFLETVVAEVVTLGEIFLKACAKK